MFPAKPTSSRLHTELNYDVYYYDGLTFALPIYYLYDILLLFSILGTRTDSGVLRI